MTLVGTLRSEWVALTTIGISIVFVLLATFVKELWFLSIAATVICGYLIAKEVLLEARNMRISTETLVLTALIAFLILGEHAIAADIAIIMVVGELIERIIFTKARSGVDALGKIKTDRARVIDGDNTYNLPLEDVRMGKHIRVLPGEIIPLDGIIIQGDSSVDRSIMTGESVPVDVCPGDEVFSGTCNLYGSIDVEVTKPASEGMINRMIRLLEEADARKSRIVDTADRWSKYILLTAVIIATANFLITENVIHTLTILVVFCPCAFVLATPAAVMASTSNMARNGVLLKDTSAIEGMNKVDMVLFDKTGTLTTGVIHSKGFTNVASDMPSEQITGLVASLESQSRHPLGMALSADHEQIGEVESFHDIHGKGFVGIVDGFTIAAGNIDLMASEAPEGLDTVKSAVKDTSCTIVYIGIDGKCIGFFSLEDTLKEESVSTIKELKGEGLRTVMLTGDNEAVAQDIANKIGMDLVVWDCKPETKLNSVEELEKSGRTCMLGDGMNDAPSLKRSTVGISMGIMGNDVAVESSDLVFVNDDISKVPGVYRLCKSTVRIVTIGLAIAMGINFAGAALAILGYIGPVAGSIIYNVGSIIVLLLSVSLLRSNAWTPRHQSKNQ